MRKNFKRKTQIILEVIPMSRKLRFGREVSRNVIVVIAS